MIIKFTNETCLFVSSSGAQNKPHSRNNFRNMFISELQNISFVKPVNIFLTIVRIWIFIGMTVLQIRILRSTTSMRIATSKSMMLQVKNNEWKIVSKCWFSILSIYTRWAVELVYFIIIRGKKKYIYMHQLYMPNIFTAWKTLDTYCKYKKFSSGKHLYNWINWSNFLLDLLPLWKWQKMY